MLDRELYPFDGSFLQTRGLKLHYLDEGPRDAPPVLMLHGNPTWSFYYRNLVKALSDRYRCIVPDHIGCGLSDKPPTTEYPYRLIRRIADLKKLIETLDLDGGRIADKQKIAIYPPDVLPAGDNQGVPVKLQRKEAIVRGEQAESPAAARLRVVSVSEQLG